MSDLSVVYANKGIFPSPEKIKQELSTEDDQYLSNMKYFLNHKINTFDQLKVFLIDLVSLLDYEDDTVSEPDFHNLRKWYLGNLAISLSGQLIYPFIDDDAGWTDKLLKKYSHLIDHYVELSSICSKSTTMLSSSGKIINLVENFLILDCFFRDVCGSNFNSLQLLLEELHRQQEHDFFDEKLNRLINI